MIRSLLHLLVVAMLTSRAAYSQNTSNVPAPHDLLRGVEASRLKLPASKLRLTAEYSGRQYELTAEFDGEKRRFWTRKNANRIRMVLSGTTVTHFDGIQSVTFRDVNNQNGSLFFDPRLLGITTTYWWNETLESELPDRTGTDLRTVGKEEIQGTMCWHVSVTDVYKQRRDLWIDDQNGYRVYRSDFSIPGFKRNSTVSIYKDEETRSLPSRVLTRYYDANGEEKTSSRQLVVLEAETHVAFDDATWGYASLQLPIGVPVTDLRTKRRLGYWNGSGLSLDPPSVGKPRN